MYVLYGLSLTRNVISLILEQTKFHSFVSNCRGKGRSNCTFSRFFIPNSINNNSHKLWKLAKLFKPTPFYFSQPLPHFTNLNAEKHCIQYKRYGSNERKWVSLYILTVLPHAFSKFSWKMNVSNYFKTLPMSDSNVFLLWFVN